MHPDPPKWPHFNSVTSVQIRSHSEVLRARTAAREFGGQSIHHRRVPFCGLVGAPPSVFQLTHSKSEGDRAAHWFSFSCHPSCTTRPPAPARSKAHFRLRGAAGDPMAISVWLRVRRLPCFRTGRVLGLQGLYPTSRGPRGSELSWLESRSQALLAQLEIPSDSSASRGQWSLTS